MVNYLRVLFWEEVPFLERICGIIILLIYSSMNGTSISKSILESSILTTTITRDSQVENEIFAPEKQNPAGSFDDVVLVTDLVSTLRVSVHNEEELNESYYSVPPDYPISSFEMVDEPSSRYLQYTY